MGGLTWLHLSDWHQKGEDFDRQVVRDALIDDIKARENRIDARLSHIDFIIFSGDAAWSGKKAEYEAAKRYLFDPVLKAANLGPDKLFIVPGNHDLDRGVVGGMLPPQLQKPFESREQANEWLTDLRKRQLLLSPFDDFRQFVESYTLQKSAEYAYIVLPENSAEKKVAILCLNSAWMCGRHIDAKGDVDDKGFLTLGEPQIHSALREIDSADIKIVVLHHHFDWLKLFDRDLIGKKVKKAAHFILLGHDHTQKVEVVKSTEGNYVIVPAGASYDRRRSEMLCYDNAYNFVHLDCETGRGEVYLRRWNDDEWMADTSAAKNGKYEFDLPVALKKSRENEGPQLQYFFEKKCKDYLREKIRLINEQLDNTIAHKDCYVEPHIYAVKGDIRWIVYDETRDEIFKSGSNRLVISSNSGFGKTIFLQKYFIKKAKEFIDNPEGIFPFYYHMEYLRELAPSSLSDLLTSNIFDTGSESNGINRQDFVSLMDDKLRSRKLLFLLDGLDQTHIEIESFKGLFGLRFQMDPDALLESNVIVASRPNAVQEFEEAFARRYQRLEISPFNFGQIISYFRNLKKNKFPDLDLIKIGRLLEDDDFYELARTPQIMSMLGQIPFKKASRKSSIYEFFCDKILNENAENFRSRFDIDRNLMVPIVKNQFEQISYIAFERGRYPYITFDFANDNIIGKVEGIDDIEYLNDLCAFGITYNIAGQVYHRGVRPFITFKHQSFQAYFAARQLVVKLKEKGIDYFKDILAKKTDDAGLEVFSFFVELDEPSNQAKELIAEALLNRYYLDKENHEMLYGAAKVFSFLPIDRAKEIKEKIKKALVEIVEVDREIVLLNERPFKALRDLNEITYLAEYSANQIQFNSINRFYAFKYAFTSHGGEDMKIPPEVEKVLDRMKAPGSTTKPDFLFALNRHPSDQVVEYFLPFFKDALTPAIRNISKFLNFYLKAKYSSKDGLQCFYDKWIVPLREEAKHVAFYVPGNPFYGQRSQLAFFKSIGLTIFEKKLLEYIYMNKTGQWKGYEDVCMVILGALANRKIGKRFFKDFLNKDVTEDGDKYKQAIAAFALACCFPGDQCRPEDKPRVEEVTTKCIDIFNSGTDNPYRYYIAAALTVIGNQRVIDYFLDFIQRRNEKQRWFATMVLGSLDNSAMISNLEELVKLEDTDEETKLFASQALLVYSQNRLMQSK